MLLLWFITECRNSGIVVTCSPARFSSAERNDLLAVRLSCVTVFNLKLNVPFCPICYVVQNVKSGCVNF